MELLTLTIPTEAPSAHSWPRVRALASIPPPAAPGLRARWWRPAPGGLLARYLFDDADALGAFERSGRAADAELSGLAGLTGLAGARARRESVDEATIDTAFDRPVLVVCAPRTGSTMLADLLARSRDLWTAEGELQGIIDGIPGLDLPSRGHRSQVLDERDATPAIARTLRACLLAELRDHRGRRRLDLPVPQRPARLRLLDKTVENALRLPFLLRVFPDAQLVLLWRDLRPNLSSMVEAWGSPGFVSIPSLPGWPGERWCFVLPEGWRERAGASPTQLAAFQWRSIHEAILDALEGLPRDRWTTARYADLIADPGATARRLCRFMDVDAAGCSELAARGPLPPSPTMLSPPSPIKWRSNRAFDPAVAASLQPLAGRIRHLAAGAAAPVLRASQPSRTRLACFVESLPAEPLPASARVSPS
ncbi:MAG: sulfotransferase, partial [Myxococcales bacterium]|nr:sulfotransferase [Myxococcales bacterium]